MWKERPIESTLRQVLERDTSIEGSLIYGRYEAARKKLVDEILPWIRKEEPDLTDHGPDHVANVLDNAQRLLGIPCGEISKDADFGFSPVEFYILCMSILFHDVGNLFGRNKHNQKIAQVYGDVFKNFFENKDEMVAVVNAGRAHCGTTETGNRDTLKELGKTPTYVFSQPVNLTMIGALVRFADELAEGPQRTSRYLLDKGLFGEDARKYHEYASITEVVIDRGGERIALTYRIDCQRKKGNNALKQELARIKHLLELIYGRVSKLDQERRYTRYYCNPLSPFKLTTVSLDFWVDGWTMGTGLPSLQLSDLVIPGDPVKQIQEIDSSYNIETLLAQLETGLEVKHE
jgi:hypothetical protein